MLHIKALITDCRALAPAYYQLDISAPEIAALAKPGQFLQVRTAGPESNDPILPRPISIYQIDQTSGVISVIFKVVGRGTRFLATRRKGELLEVTGPVGNGFARPDHLDKVALIAGGIGMPPLFCLAENWLKQPNAPSFDLFYGGRSSLDLLAVEAWRELGCGLFLATDDGSTGYHGTVTEALRFQIQATHYDYLVGCGPIPMLRAVQTLAAETGIPGQMSLEAFMACGVGACLGCACQTKQGYRRVCVDGPVFDAGEVVLS